MSRLPRDLSGFKLTKKLSKLGYAVTRQTGSHVRLTCSTPSQHHVTIPAHDPLKIGTLAAIITDIAKHHGLTRDEVIALLD